MSCAADGCELAARLDAASLDRSISKAGEIGHVGRYPWRPGPAHLCHALEAQEQPGDDVSRSTAVARSASWRVTVPRLRLVSSAARRAGYFASWISHRLPSALRVIPPERKAIRSEISPAIEAGPRRSKRSGKLPVWLHRF